MILKKDGKIVVNNGKILTNDGKLNPSVATKVQEALSNSLDNKNAIEKIISGEIPIGSIISISVDGKEIKTDINGNVDLSIAQYKGGSKINYSSETGKLSLLDSANNVISEVNLPLESFVKSGRYNSVTKEIELTLTSDEVIKIPVEKLIDVYKADEKDITLKSDNTFELTDNFKLRFNNKVDKNQLSDYALKTETVTQDELDTKQNKLTSGGNIKTINGLSLLGAGNLNFADSELTDNSTITINLGSTNDAKWYRLAKVDNPYANASGTFVLDYYEDDYFVSSTTFKASCSLDNKDQLISEICPLIRVPNELQEASEGGSANWLNAGLISVRIEKSEDGIFIVGLINSINPTLEKKQDFNITIQNAINFKVSENLKTVIYKYDNEKIDLTDEIDISEDVNFNIKMEYKKYKSLLNKGMFEGYNIINGQKGNGKNYVIFGFKSLNDGVKTWTFCNNECDGLPISFDEIIQYEVTSDTPTSGDLDWNINNEKIINKLGVGVHALTITYDGASENLYHFRLNEEEINDKTTLEEEYGIYLNNLDEIYWDQGKTEAIIITVSAKSTVNRIIEINKQKNNLVDYINQNYVNQISPYAKIGFEKIYGELTLIAGENGSGVFANKNGNLLSVNSGETKSITVALTKEENYYIQGSSDISATFKPLLDTGVSELESIISFDFDNTFSLSGVSENSEFINTFPSDTLKTVTYQYGIDAELISYDLYDLSSKLNELSNKDFGECLPLDGSKPMSGDIKMGQLQGVTYKSGNGISTFGFGDDGFPTILNTQERSINISTTLLDDYYNYTFPEKSGTVVLTDDLESFVKRSTLDDTIECDIKYDNHNGDTLKIWEKRPTEDDETYGCFIDMTADYENTARYGASEIIFIDSDYYKTKLSAGRLEIGNQVISAELDIEESRFNFTLQGVGSTHMSYNGFIVRNDTGQTVEITSNCIKIGNTELTEEKLQQLLALLNK